jgi:alanyl-tRNA synthetase
MEANEIRSRFLKFFENRGHKIIPSASLVPENDPSVLFNTAGMQPLVPYLLGQKHPMGNRLADAQKCVRTVDIDEVGDNRHLTFFEMLGNWSLGDYFKEDAIKWSYEFLTSSEEGLGLDQSKIYVTVFEGDANAPRDEEAAKIWQKYIPQNRIYFLPAKNNWWHAGDNGPCGPDTEIFYDINEQSLGDLSHDQFVEADTAGKVVEIWNNVFMQYEKKDGKVIGKLKKHNVDTGMGLERIAMVSQKKKNVYETDLFNNEKTKEERIVADHVKTAFFMIGDGVTPSNTGAGYVLRRLIRRAVRFSKQPLINEIEKIKRIYEGVYVLDDKGEIEKEENKFRQTLQHGLKEFEKGVDPFVLATTYGFPIELTIELAKEKGRTIDLVEYNKKMTEHQKLSHTSSAGMFKGGLANHNEKTIKLHTVHHLLLAGLKAIVDKNIKQRGSNITEERLRMDFLCNHKLTDEEKKKVEKWVNDRIKEGLDVVRREMPLTEAQKIGAEMEFGAKYPDLVSLYFIEDKNGDVISKEFCGGPHVSNTKELGEFKIQKEEAVAQGIRRIKAVLVL